MASSLNKRESDLDRQAKSLKSGTAKANTINKGEWVTHISLPSNIIDILFNLLNWFQFYWQKKQFTHCLFYKLVEFDEWQVKFIESLKTQLKRKFAKNISDVITCDEFHISVSRTLRIRRPQIAELTSILENKLKEKQK